MTNGSGTTSYTYEDADRITEVQPPSPAAAIDYTWDDNGNLVERGSDTFAWDYEDRMVEATVNSETSTFAYRGDGPRDSRTVGMSTTTFTWDINAGLPVVLDDGNQYLYGAGLSAMKQSGNWFCYLADGLGSTMAIVDANGDAENGYTYDVYGEPTITGSLANDFDFGGRQSDASTGLQYLRARYYDPATGTFISRDPLATSPGFTGSAFAAMRASPANFTDPAGLCPNGFRYCYSATGVWTDGPSDAPDDSGAVSAAFRGGICDTIGGAVSNVAGWAGGQGAKAWDAAMGLTSAVKDAARAAINSQLTGIALAAAEGNGGGCSLGAGLFWVCKGVDFVDSLNDQGFTVGNVYLLGHSFREDKLFPASISHESRHADAWAAFGAATLPTPLMGQALMFGTYMANQGVTGANSCRNLFEIFAGLGDGRYNC